MKKAISVICILLFCSCNYFEGKKIHVTDERIQKHLDSLDKSTIDNFPIFPDCEQLDENIEAEKECFISSLSNHITNSLAQNQLVLKEELDISFKVAIEVSEEGKITIISIDINNVLKERIPNIEQIIQQSINELPKIEPALKKLQLGDLVPVKTQFVIPIRVVAKLAD